MKTIIVSVISCFLLISCFSTKPGGSDNSPPSPLKKDLAIFLYADVIDQEAYESLISLRDKKFNGKNYISDTLSSLQFVYIPSNSSQNGFSATFTERSKKNDIKNKMSIFFGLIEKNYMRNKDNMFNSNREILDAFEKMLALSTDPTKEYKYIFISDMLESSGTTTFDTLQCRVNGRFRFIDINGVCQSGQINTAITLINDNKNRSWIYQNLIEEYSKLDKSKIKIDIFTSNLSPRSNGVYTAKDALHKFWKELFLKVGFEQEAIKINRMSGSVVVI
ncbi:hypothetical protein GCM10028807_36360 [Spirosoma daeguense]